MHVLGQDALNIGDQVRIKAELQDGAGPGLAGKLCIQHLIRPGSKLARPLDAGKEIGSAMPAPALEGRLIDDLGAVAHCRDCKLEPRAILVRAELCYAAALSAKMIEIGLFERQPPLLEHCQRGIAPLGRLAIARCNRQIQLGEVMTAEMIGEVARGQFEPVKLHAHINLLYK